ncbi:hypothetical protein KPH14_002338 [Odynerus spinipes]|uniref:Uncharacterized protein n=1 Tax=Odynerus spinipes TaxID=1348599 RepID=A0AAD9RLI6_9HYME|nr:hypothetical protein KPH14_002338 [Odynerus spinipes]
MNISAKSKRMKLVHVYIIYTYPNLCPLNFFENNRNTFDIILIKFRILPLKIFYCCEKQRNICIWKKH